MRSNHEADGARRVIGPVAGIAVVAGSMLGVGIFLFPREVAEQIQSPALFLALWGLGGLVALAGATAYGELGAMIPRGGGDYVYLREAYGGSVAFASGWLLFLGVFGGSIATLAVAVAEYQLPVLLGSFTDIDLTATVATSSWLGGELTGTQLAAIGMVVLLTGINAAGARPSMGTQTLATSIPVLVFGVFALYALATGASESARPAIAESATVGSPATSLSTAFLAIYFAYAGWNAVAYVGGEVRRPGRNVPLSLIGGTLLITALYLMLCWMFLTVLGMGGLVNAYEAGTASAVTVMGPQAELPVAALIAVALIGSLNGTVLGGARIGYAMAHDRALPAVLGRLSPHTRVPARALWLQAALAIVLVVTGTFSELVALTSIAMLVLGSLTVVALFVLRRRRPGAERPYRATGYPWVQLIYLLASGAVIGASVWRAVGHGVVPDEGLSRYYPLLGIAVFVVILVARAGWTRLTSK